MILYAINGQYIEIVNKKKINLIKEFLFILYIIIIVSSIKLMNE